MKRTKPTFSLTGFVPLKVLRGGADSLVNGRPAKGLMVEIELERANVQPLNFKEITFMPQGEGTRDWIKVFSYEELRTLSETDEGHQADIVLWKGFKWRVVKVKQYNMGVLDHFVSYAVKEIQGAGYAT